MPLIPFCQGLPNQIIAHIFWYVSKTSNAASDIPLPFAKHLRAVDMALSALA